MMPANHALHCRSRVGWHRRDSALVRKDPPSLSSGRQATLHTMKLLITFFFFGLCLGRGAEITGQVQVVRRTNYLAGPQYAPSTNELRPYVVLTGANSHIKIRDCSLITTAADEWAALWLRHTGQSTNGMYFDGKYKYSTNPGGVPTIDFSRCVVVALFQGPGFNSNGFDVADVVTEGEVTMLRLAERWYQSYRDGVSVTAYGFFVMPRPDKVLVIQENVQHTIGRPPIWKERARFSKIPR